ncbi:MAG TPA: hypothetical protein VF538_16295 [Pyrinomonadaceae bacterium]|jgi:hypothetical protein
MTDERIVAYLLAELPEGESERFEEECFAQEDWPDQINLVEEELIDDYLRGELAPGQRKSFERNYLTTAARRERVRMAAALLCHVDQCSAVNASAVNKAAAARAGQTWHGRLRAFWEGQSMGLRAASALAALVIIAGAWWLARPHTSEPQTFVELALTRSVDNTRAEGVAAPKVILPLKADALKISLTLPGGPSRPARYRAELENLDNAGGEIKPLETVGQDARSVSVVIPAAQLSRGQYALKLFAAEDGNTERRVPGNYFFVVG